MSAVLDALPHFTALLSPEGAIRFVNAPALAAIGRSLAALEGEPLWLTPWWDFDPQAQAQFSEALGTVSLDDFYGAVNDVRPSVIRVEAPGPMELAVTP